MPDGKEVVFYQRKFSAPDLPQPIRRDAQGRVLPGQSLNPLGRARSFKPLIDAITGDGEELVLHAIEQMRGTPRVITNPLDGTVQVQVPTIAESERAREQLLQRGYGAVVKAVELTGRDGGPMQLEGSQGPQERDLTKLTPQELRTLIQLVSKTTPPSEQTVDAEVLPPQGSE